MTATWDGNHIHDKTVNPIVDHWQTDKSYKTAIYLYKVHANTLGMLHSTIVPRNRVVHYAPRFHVLSAGLSGYSCIFLCHFSKVSPKLSARLNNLFCPMFHKRNSVKWVRIAKFGPLRKLFIVDQFAIINMSIERLPELFNITTVTVFDKNSKAVKKHVTSTPRCVNNDYVR